MYRKFPHLSAPMQIGDIVLRNRMFSAPMAHPNITQEGLITPEAMAFYELRAKGGAAVVTVSEAITHYKTGKSHDRNINLNADYVILGLAETARVIKRHGAAASIELSHGGYRSNVDSSEKNSASQEIKYGASSTILPDGKKVLEMPKEVIHDIVTSFGEGAALCKHAGFDMIMLHGGHGWLINQFLSPYTNKRSDKYGGSLENRARLALEILDSVRGAVGPSFPIEFRMSAEEYVEGGYDFSEAIEFAKLIESRIDLLHVSTGNLNFNFNRTHPTMFEERGCNVIYAAEMKKHVKVPVVTIGAISDPIMMEEIIASGKADAISMARALQADPFLPHKAVLGREEEITPCIRCLTCFADRFSTKSRICAVNPLIGSEITYRQICPAPLPKKVLVAGGGPGGMQAAITAAQRGHKVILCEKSGELGGAFKHEQNIPFKADVYNLIGSKELELRRAGVEVRLNTPVTEAYVEKEAPDALVVAIGAVPFRPPLDESGGPHVLMAEEGADRLDFIGNEVVILGGGLVGCELAIFLADNGRKVTIAEMTDTLAANSNSRQQSVVLRKLQEYNNIIVKTGFKGTRVM
ncbi:MAG: FAD-dependent oxidoreductase, partial [Clostridiales bacterium]|nr:FAD-dependent oxidoreductase [Clostridiales bacterium]